MANAHAARRVDAQPLAAVQPQRADLPLRAAEPRPVAAGVEDHRGLGARAALPLDPGRGGRFRLRRHHHAVPGAARPEQAVRLRRHRAADLRSNLPTTTPTRAAASTRRAGSSTTSAAWGWCATPQDIGNIVVAQKNGIPVYVRDVAQVQIGHAPRLGQFGYMRQDEAVEGVILMRVGEQAQVILKRVEAMTKDLNEHVLPPDVKIVPYYDRQGLIEETTRNGGAQPAARHAAGAGDPGAVPVQRAHGADRGGHHSRSRCCSRSSAWTGGTFRRTCFPSAPSISASSWTARW